MQRKRRIDCWVDEASGLPCLILLGRMGESLGYVGVPPDHPYYDMPQSLTGLKAYGGSQLLRGDSPGPILMNLWRNSAISSQYYGRDRLYVFGFDCATGMDYVPGLVNLGLSDELMEEHKIAIPPVLKSLAEQEGRKFRDDEFVRNECRYLAAQLARATSPDS